MNTSLRRAIFVLAISLSIQTSFGLVFHLTAIQYKGVIVYLVTPAQASDIYASEHPVPNPCNVNFRLRTCASPDGRIIASAQQNGTVTICDASSGKLIATVYQPHSESIERQLGLFVAPQGALIRGLYIEALSISPNGKFLATQRTDEPAIVWNVQGSLKKRILEWPPSRRYDMARELRFSMDSKLLVSLGSHYDDKSPGCNRLAVWDISTRKQLLYLRSSKNSHFERFLLSPDGKTLTTIAGQQPGLAWPKFDRKNAVQMWDIRTGTKRVFIEQGKLPKLEDSRKTGFPRSRE
jgi:WD40 repeat protein